MMTRYNWLVIAIIISLVATSLYITHNSHQNIAYFFNPLGLFIVITGTLGALFMSYSSGDIVASLRVAKNTFTVRPPTTDEVVNTLMDLSVRTRRKGILALENVEEETTVSFLRRALEMLVDAYSANELRDILYTEMHYFRERRAHQERVFRHAARLAPAFGVAGSVIGLISMLAIIEQPELVMQNMATALTSILYGIILGSFILTPIAENINAKTEKELMMQRLVTDGVMAIQSEQNSLRLAKKLESFLTPAARQGSQHSIEEIRERVRKLQKE